MKTSTLEIGIDAALAAVEKSQNRLSTLPDPLRVVVMVHAAQGVLDNGGLRYFFESNFPEAPPYRMFVESYRQIGALEEAEVLEKAIARFRFPDPHREAERRNLLLDQWEVEEDVEWRSWNSALVGNEHVWEQLERFIERHIQWFVEQQ